MSLSIKLNSRLSSLQVRPDWRSEVLRNPAKYQLQDLTFVPVSENACLNRFIPLNLDYEVTFKHPHHLSYYLDNLNSEEQELLLTLHNKSHKKSKRRKLVCRTSREIFNKIPLWRQSLLHKVSDTYLKRLIRHHMLWVHDDDIDFAVKFKQSDNIEILRFIGYCIYAKVSDKDIALRWNLKISHVTALRKLYFDFERVPKDRLANLAYLRQLANIGYLDEVDFSYYKRVFDLGELGLKAQVDYFGLTDEEKNVVIDYLGKSVISNALNINFAIRNQKDAYSYAGVAASLADYSVKGVEREYMRAKIDNLQVSTKKLESTIIGAGKDDLTDTDQKFINLLREYSLTENNPNIYKSVQDLQ